MNGRTAKLLRKVFDDPKEGRRFRKAYTQSDIYTQSEARRVANKIKDARGKGNEVKTFHVKPGTHNIEVDNES